MSVRSPKLEVRSPNGRPGSYSRGNGAARSKPPFGIRISELGIRNWLHSVFLVAAARLVAATNETAGPNQIPPLRPPKAEIPPGFWEQHGLALILTAVGVVLVLIGLWRLLAQRKPEPPPLPSEVARQALELLHQRQVDSQLLSEVSRILRDYFISAFGLPRQEYTNNELCHQLQAGERVNAELVTGVTATLRGLESRRFDSDANNSSLDVVEEALKLIDQSEEHLQQLSSASAASHAQSDKRCNHSGQPDLRQHP